MDSQKLSLMASFQVQYAPAKNQRDKKPLQLAPQGHFLRGVDGTFTTTSILIER